VSDRRTGSGIDNEFMNLQTSGRDKGRIAIVALKTASVAISPDA
jgi:hypothetical protein